MRPWCKHTTISSDGTCNSLVIFRSREKRISGVKSKKKVRKTKDPIWNIGAHVGGWFSLTTAWERSLEKMLKRVDWLDVCAVLENNREGHRMNVCEHFKGQRVKQESVKPLYWKEKVDRSRVWKGMSSTTSFFPIFSTLLSLFVRIPSELQLQLISIKEPKCKTWALPILRFPEKQVMYYDKHVSNAIKTR